MSNVPEQPDPSSDTCTGCLGRRAFLRDAIGAAVAVVGLSAAAPLSELHALGQPSGSGSHPIAPGGALLAGVPVRYKIPAADGVSIDQKNEVILCRSRNEVYAFALSCPHQNTALRALPGTAGFQCPKHKSRYQPNGAFISGRATRNMDRLPIARDGDVVVVTADVIYESDRDPARWSAAVVTL